MFGLLFMMESIFFSSLATIFLFLSADSFIKVPDFCEIGFLACCCEQLAIRRSMKIMGNNLMFIFIIIYEWI